MPLLDGGVWFAGLIEAARGNSLELEAWAAELLESTDQLRGSVRDAGCRTYSCGCAPGGRLEFRVCAVTCRCCECEKCEVVRGGIEKLARQK